MANLSDATREILRKEMTRNMGVIFGILVVILAWGNYLGNVTRGYNAFDLERPPAAQRESDFKIALGGTGLGLLLAAAGIFQTWLFLRYGVEVLGRVTVGRWSVRHFTRIWCAYEFGGRMHRKVKSISSHLADRFRAQPEIAVVVLPFWPGFCLIPEATVAAAGERAKKEGIKSVDVLVTTLCLGLAVYAYLDFTRLEQEGGEEKGRSIISWLYNVGGKWAVVAPFGILGLVFLFDLVKKIFRRGKG